MDKLVINEKIKLNITPQFQKQIDFLHEKIGNIEWCGVLITKDEGSVTDPENFKITPQYIYLMDIGSHSYTEATFGLGIIDMYERYPEIEKGEFKTHIIHTHSLICGAAN